MTDIDADRIWCLGHRGFVGGDGLFWNKLARLQFDFLKSQGLRRSDILLDIACGSLRAGRLFIDYLHEGNYLGIEKEVNLLIHGVAKELSIETFELKKPQFVVSRNFEFEKFTVQPNFAIAQSLFTHLTAEDIYRCLKSLRTFISGKIKFFATFFEVLSPQKNLTESDSLECFFYTREQLDTIAQLSGWHMHYIGEWGHPRDQQLLRLEPI